MGAARVAGRRRKRERPCPPRRESGREKRNPCRRSRPPYQLGCPDPGSRRPIPASTPCEPDGLPVPCVTVTPETSRTRARESFRRTCERSAGYPTAISSSGRHPPPSTVVCTSAPPHAKGDPCSSSAPTCRRRSEERRVGKEC